MRHCIVDRMHDAIEYATFADAATTAEHHEACTLDDTRIDSTAEGYVVRVLDQDGDMLGWIGQRLSKEN